MDKTLSITPHRQPWFVYLHFPFHLALKEYVKALPGSSWVQAKRAWLLPAECVNQVKKEAAKYGFITHDES